MTTLMWHMVQGVRPDCWVRMDLAWTVQTPTQSCEALMSFHRVVQGTSLAQAQALLSSQQVAEASAQLLAQSSRLLATSASSQLRSAHSVARALTDAAARTAFVDVCITRVVQQPGRDVSREASSRVQDSQHAVMLCDCCNACSHLPRLKRRALQGSVRGRCHAFSASMWLQYWHAWPLCHVMYCCLSDAV